MVRRWKRADRRRDGERGDRWRIKEMKLEQTLKTDGIEFGLVTPSHAYFLVLRSGPESVESEFDLASNSIPSVTSAGCFDYRESDASVMPQSAGRGMRGLTRLTVMDAVTAATTTTDTPIHIRTNTVPRTPRRELRPGKCQSLRR